MDVNYVKLSDIIYRKTIIIRYDINLLFKRLLFNVKRFHYFHKHLMRKNNFLYEKVKS